MALTHDEVKRWAGKFDETVILDTDLKSDVLKKQLGDYVGKIETKLKRTKGKVIVCYGEMK
ncbi:MAG: hypothetical protein RL768_427 [Nitrospirota bacterium]|jgi:hypothetical protein